MNVRITIAAMIPTSSLDSVAGLETFWPSWPPVSTSSPAAFAGSAAASMIVLGVARPTADRADRSVTDR